MRKVLNLFTVLLLITALVLPVCATAVNSVRQPGAPVVSEVDDETVTVVVTPLVEQEKASWSVKQEMQTATKALHDGDLTKVKGVQDALKVLNEMEVPVKPGNPDVKPGTPAETKPGAAEENVPAETMPQERTEIKAENLVVSEVFHVDADRTGIAVTFEAEGIRAGQFLMVMVFVDGEWVVLDFEDVEIIEDGKVRITFDQLGTVAFVVDKNEMEQYAAEDLKKADMPKKDDKSKKDDKPKNNNGKK